MLADLVLAADEPVHHLNCRLFAYRLSTGVLELKCGLIVMLQEAENTINEGKQAPAPMMAYGVALAHHLSDGLVESDLGPGSATEVTGRILSE